MIAGRPQILTQGDDVHLRSAQIVLLTLASLYFYAFDQPKLVLLLLLSISINAISSYGLIQAKTRTVRLAWAWLGVGANLAVLLFFKYGPLAGRTLGLENASDGSLGFLLIHMPLPIGISFFTFQGISLVVDVYRHTDQGMEQRAHGSFWLHFRDTAFFKAFFPQLVAGPIVKAHIFYPQIGEKKFRSIEWEQALGTMIIGYFLKMVVADNLKDLTFWISFPYFKTYSSFTLLVLLFGYSIQIFADFAGYSLIAIGVGRLFGYELTRNFNFPYISQSLSEFWRRWHISLSSWLRDYLYIPLGGNRFGSARTYLNLMVVMALGGLWHGASWSYAIWGIYHGLGLALERALQAGKPSANQSFSGIKCALVFSFVSMGWLLFKLPNFDEAIEFVCTLGRNLWVPESTDLIFKVILYTVPVIAYHWYALKKEQVGDWISPRARILIYGLCLFFLMSNSGSAGAFIYFQF